MTTKVYGIYGRTTAIVDVPSGNGKARVRVEFNRGVPNAGPGYRPATFSTSDPIVQSVLENSKLYGSLYTLVRVRHEADAQPVKPAAPTNDAPETTVVPEVTSKEEAVAYLKSKGAKATNLKDDDAIKKYMAKIGVQFPNCEI